LHLSGYDLFRQIHASSKIPVVFLTCRDSDVDVVVGLELGARGYLKKPLGPRIVAARVKALLRSLEPKAAAAATKPQEEDDKEAEFEIKDQPQPDFRIDEKAKAIYYNRIRLELTVSQYAILSRMVRQPRRVFPPDMILDWINPDGTATEYSV
jgi:DNA-binding response OmpR family regulator